MRNRSGGTEALIVAALLAAGTACRAPRPQGTAELARGEATYGRYCAPCHGETGDGQGSAAYLLFPKPRNFQRAQFKLRSTPEGVLPTDEDLVRTVTQGIPGSSMLGFGAVLDRDEIADVVRYVKSLSPSFAEAGPIQADQRLSVPEPPPSPTPELVARGKELYGALHCAQCHGPEGRGDGPSAPTLRDSEGDPFPAADFTYGIYKSGGEPAALYRTFLTGMAGTPMPSFAAAFRSEEEPWALVYYLLSLGPDEPRPVVDDAGPVAIAELPDPSALEDPWAPAWDTVSPHRVVLRPLWYRNDYPRTVTLRWARAGGRLGLLVQWRDPSRDAAALGTETFSDGVAVQFALSEPPPFVGMGASGGGGEVEVWYWRSDRQAAADSDRVPDVTDAHPNLWVDYYPLSSADGGGTGRPMPGPAGEQPAPFVAGRDAGNPVSDPELLLRPVHELSAAGFGTLTSHPAAAMRASGRGGWRDDSYRVAFEVPEGGASPRLAARFGGGRVQVAVAVWDGSAGDRNGTKLVSQWQTLEISGGPGAAGDAPGEVAAGVGGAAARPAARAGRRGNR